MAVEGLRVSVFFLSLSWVQRYMPGASHILSLWVGRLGHDVMIGRIYPLWLPSLFLAFDASCRGSAASFLNQFESDAFNLDKTNCVDGFR